ncbi:MAG: endonuclease, partial [Leifsonia sp.]|nr:endonuclease [Leifsonia sp.]
DTIAPDVLRQATSTLATEGATCNVDELAAMARGVRDTLDRVGVADRERHLRAQRSLRKSAVVDGLRRVTLVLDPESDAILTGAIEAAMSPRLGGPRFVDPADQDRAAGLVEDPRTNEQMALDVLVDLVRIGVDRDDGAILGSSKPALRVTISLDDLTRAVDAFGQQHPGTDTGVAWLEGSSEPFSAATARRILCDRGVLPIVLGGASEPLDLGRTRRLFTGAQRVALANRDGGCRWPECDRPPSWCEAHHINPYSTGGTTNLTNGVLLCRRHHLLLHNHGWRIEHAPNPDQLQLIPPASVDPTHKPRPMPTKLPPWLKTG